MALTEAEKRAIFAGVAKKTKPLADINKPKSKYDKSWLRNFAEELFFEAEEKGFMPGVTMFKGAANEDLPTFKRGARGLAIGAVAPFALAKVGQAARSETVAKHLPTFKKAALTKIKLPELPKVNLSKLAGDETGALGDVAAAKVGRAKKLIEEAGGKKVKYDHETNTMSWVDHEGKSKTFDLTQRFGPRQVGSSERQTGVNAREMFQSPRDKLLNPRMTEQGKLYRTTAEAKRAGEIEEAGKAGKKLGDLPSLKGERGSFSFGKGKDQLNDLPKLKDRDTELDELVARLRSENPELDRRLREAAIEGPTTPKSWMTNQERQDYIMRKRAEKEAALKATGIETKKSVPVALRGKNKPDRPIEEYGEGFEYPVKEPQRVIKGRDGSEWNVEVHDKAAFDDDGEVVLWITSRGRKEPEIGSLSLRPSSNGDTLDISVAGLSENMQGRGIGTALYQEALRYAKKKGFKGISSDPGLRNKRSNALWEKIKTGTEYDRFGEPIDVKMYGGLPVSNKSLSKYVLGPMRTLMSMGEFSAPLRQARRTMFTHPIRGAQATIDMFRSALSEKGLDKVNTEANRRLRLAGIKPGNVGLAIKDSGLLQQFGDDPLAKLPLISHSERGYEGFMRSLRSRRAADLIKPDMPQRHKVRLADLINDQTGYGRLGTYRGMKFGKPEFKFRRNADLESAADDLADWFYSPRYFASRAHQINPLNLLPGGISRYGRMDNPAYREHLKDTAKDVGILGAGLYGLDKSGVAHVDWDPRSTQFLRPKFGDTTMDVTGGMGSLVGRAGQLVSGQSSYDGKLSNKNRWSTAGRTLRSLLAPGPSLAVDIFSGKNYMGEPSDLPMDAFDWLPDEVEKPIEEIPYGAEVIENYSPMWWGDVVDTSRRSTLSPLGQSLIGAAGFFGASSRTDKEVNIEQKKKGKKGEVKPGQF